MPGRLFAAPAMMMAVMLLAMVPPSALAGTGVESDPYTQQDNVAICHAVSENSSNDFIAESPSVSAMFAAGHPVHQNGRDSIPSFYYLDGETVLFFRGLNYDATGQAILWAGCVIVELPTPTPIPTMEPGVPPTITPTVDPTVEPTVAPTKAPVETPTKPPTEASKVPPAPAKAVTGLPSTGAGTSQSDQVLIAVAGLTAVAMIAVGIRRRTEGLRD